MILKGIDGTINPGTLLAIMGSSGGKFSILIFNEINVKIAGKTTLLNVLAGRVDGVIEGRLLMNGYTKEEAKPL